MRPPALRAPSAAARAMAGTTASLKTNSAPHYLQHSTTGGVRSCCPALPTLRPRRRVDDQRQMVTGWLRATIVIREPAIKSYADIALHATRNAGASARTDKAARRRDGGFLSEDF